MLRRWGMLAQEACYDIARASSLQYDTPKISLTHQICWQSGRLKTRADTTSSTMAILSTVRPLVEMNASLESLI